MEYKKNLKKAQKYLEKAYSYLGVSLVKDTPERYIKMMDYLTSYQNISNEDIAAEVNKVFEIDTKTSSKNVVIVKDIEAFSLCEHHIALMYDMRISIAYMPKTHVIGLSKIVRLADMVCKRLQLQEKIGDDIVEVMKILTKSEDIAVHIKAKHSCVTARGIKNVSAETITTNFSGIFHEPKNFEVFLSNLKA